MNRDLTELLDEWPYEPGELHVRLIEGTDGEPKIQVRLDLGVLQMNAEGRPDGTQPHGYDSMLEYLEARIDGIEPPREPDQEHENDDGPENVEPEPTETESETDQGETGAFAPAEESDDESLGTPRLTGEDCRQLRDEALQYYHRYVALHVLEDFEGVVRDTSRNLRVLDLLSEHAENEADRSSLEPHRGYIVMMRARAMASQAIKDNEPKLALHAIDQGLVSLRNVYEEHGDATEFESSREAEMLRSMRDALVPKLPVSQKAELRKRLQDAILNENYELAAILRDELRMLPD